MKKVKLYNVFFPLWFIVFFPPIILITLPVNFIIDSIVLLLLLKIYKFDNIKKIYKEVIFKLWIVGFVADIIGALMLLAVTIFDAINILPDGFIEGVMSNPFISVWSFIYVVLSIIISGCLIYVLNLKYSVKEVKNNKKIALWVAILTAPYFFLFPTTLLYRNASTIYYDQLHKYENTYIGDNSKVTAIVNKVINNNDEIELITNRKPYTIIISIDEYYEEVDFTKDSAIIFKLVINAEEILYRFRDKELLYKYDIVNQKYNENLKELNLRQIINRACDETYCK